MRDRADHGAARKGIMAAIARSDGQQRLQIWNRSPTEVRVFAPRVRPAPAEWGEGIGPFLVEPVWQTE